MRTANNTNNYTVEGLVAKYRNYVKEHCPKSYSVCEGNDGKLVEIFTPLHPHANADEQLIVTLYSFVTGNNADEKVISALSQYAENYQRAALEEEEYAFLCEHFNEVVAYEFTHRSEWIGGHPYGSHVPSQILELIQNMAEFKEGQTVFVADAGYCDVAVLFSGCVVKGFTGYCGSTMFYDEVWALGQIRLYAAGIKSEIVSGSFDEANDKYTYTLPEKRCADVVICGTMWDSECEDTQQLYDLLSTNGTMFLFSNRNRMAGNGKERSFRQQLVSEKAIHTLASFEEDGFIGIPIEVILVYIKRIANKTVHIANCKRETSNVVKAEELDSDILWPIYYMMTRPSEGQPLSSVVELAPKNKLAKFIKGKGHILPEEAKDMLFVLPSNLSESYKDANLWGKSVCYANDYASKGENWVLAQVVKQPCVLLSGNSEKLKIGYTTKVGEKGFAYLAGCCLIPKEGIDIRYVAALLLSHSVSEQILTICNGSVNSGTLSLALDKIIVPDHNEKDRFAFLAEANYDALISSQGELKDQHEQYRKVVRMRKHALTQSLSSVRSMFNALNNYRNLHNGNISDNELISRVKGTTVKEAFEFIDKNIKDMMPALEHIADVEYSFNKPEWIDPERFVEEYITKKGNGWLNFKPTITWEKGHNLAKGDLKDQFTGQLILKKGDAVNTLLFPTDALERVFNNIVSNAQAHGFTDSSRKDYELRFSWHTDGIALIIEIENNGTAIPSDRDTASLLEYGVSSALHQNGHNGIGCNEINDIMRRHDGKVEIVSSPENEFAVKYVLTFNRSNIVESFNL